MLSSTPFSPLPADPLPCLCAAPCSQISGVIDEANRAIEDVIGTDGSGAAAARPLPQADVGTEVRAWGRDCLGSLTCPPLKCL